MFKVLLYTLLYPREESRGARTVIVSEVLITREHLRLVREQFAITGAITIFDVCV